MKFNLFFTIGCGYILLLVGYCSAVVGTLPIESIKPYSWGLPITMFVVLVIPFCCGYLANIDN